MKIKVNFLSAVLIILLIITGCKKDSDTTTATNPPANEVWIQNMAFNPSSITVPVNTTVKWTNKDGTTHTVTSNTTLFNSGNLGNGATFSFKFTTAGTFPYHCTIHSSMTASVIVQ